MTPKMLGFFDGGNTSQLYNWGLFVGYIGDGVLPSHVGIIIINHYKDPC